MKKANIFVRISKLSAISLLITVFASCGGKDSSSSDSSSDASSGNSPKTAALSDGYTANDIRGTWSYEDTFYGFGQELTEIGTTNYYDDGIFKEEYVAKDKRGNTKFSGSAVGNYTVENNQIKYDINKENVKIKLGSELAKDYDTDIWKYLMWVLKNEPEQIASVKGDELTTKDNDSAITTYKRIDTSDTTPDSATLKALTSKNQSGKYSVKDLVGTWSSDYKPFDDAYGTESYTFYDGDSFKYSLIEKDEDNELIMSVDAHGRYKVVNDKIEYLVDLDNVSVKYGKNYADWLQEDEELSSEDDQEYTEWLGFIDGSKIVSLTSTKMVIKDSDGERLEYYKQK